MDWVLIILQHDDDKEKFLKTGYWSNMFLVYRRKRVGRVEAAMPRRFEIKEEIESMRKAVDEYARQYAVMPPEELEIPRHEGNRRS